MKGSRKGLTPPQLQAWLDGASPDWQPAYPFDSADVRNEVRANLLREQRGLCVYCGRRLNLVRPGETYHVEHFRPRRFYSELATTYSNLLLSCGQKDSLGEPSQTCGNYKGDWFDENHHVPPDYPHCARRFHFGLNGSVTPRVENDVGAENMIKHLNLNHPELAKDREDVLMLVDGGALEEIDFFVAGEQAAQSYAHVVYEHLGLTLP